MELLSSKPRLEGSGVRPFQGGSPGPRCGAGHRIRRDLDWQVCADSGRSGEAVFGTSTASEGAFVKLGGSVENLKNAELGRQAAAESAAGQGGIPQPTLSCPSSRPFERNGSPARLGSRTTERVRDSDHPGRPWQAVQVQRILRDAWGWHYAATRARGALRFFRLSTDPQSASRSPTDVN
jgi:hypothetical protein